MPATRGPRVAKAAPRPVEIIKRTDAGFVVQPKRWVIKRTLAWACINRRLARDVERATATARAARPAVVPYLVLGSGKQPAYMARVDVCGPPEPRPIREAGVEGETG